MPWGILEGLSWNSAWGKDGGEWLDRWGYSKIDGERVISSWFETDRQFLWNYLATENNCNEDVVWAEYTRIFVCELLERRGGKRVNYQLHYHAWSWGEFTKSYSWAI